MPGAGDRSAVVFYAGRIWNMNNRQVDRVVAIRDGKTSTETIRQVSQLEQAMVGEILQSMINLAPTQVSPGSDRQSDPRM